VGDQQAEQSSLFLRVEPQEQVVGAASQLQDPDSVIEVSLVRLLMFLERT
jgi:hypothetical protein